jgi:hypothetical protein
MIAIRGKNNYSCIPTNVLTLTVTEAPRRGEILKLQLWEDSNSQCGQESLILSLLAGKKHGHYLEIGAWDYKDDSNTFLLETKFNWKGLAVEISKKYAKKYNKNRTNYCINSDALKLNYAEILKRNNFPPVIDYLQLDIDPSINTFNCLLKMPLSDYKFKVITFEHDIHADPQNAIYQSIGHSFLENHGYQRIAKNVRYNGFAFEDWYVNPSFVNLSDIPKLSDDSNWQTHFE